MDRIYRSTGGTLLFDGMDRPLVRHLSHNRTSAANHKQADWRVRAVRPEPEMHLNLYNAVTMGSKQIMLISCLAMLLAVFTGCVGKPEVPTMEELLPPGYREAAVPPEFKTDLEGNFGRGLAWMRCIDCDLDWNGLVSRVSSGVSSYGYQDTTAMWTKAMDLHLEDTGMTDDQIRNYIKCYSKPSGYGGLVIMINLSLIKNLGASVGTGGDYIVVVGWDDIKQY